MERYDIRVNVWGDVSGPQYEWETVRAEDGDFVLYADAQATVEALQQERDEAIEAASLPTWVCDGCGRVSSEGWINRVIDSFEGTGYEMECPTCGVRAIEEDCASDLVRECDDLQAALDAERERSKKQAEEAMVVFSKLSQLQALVRALPVPEEGGFPIVEVDGDYYVNHTSRFSTKAEADAYTGLLIYRATLDATTPAGGG